jgi:hypothetical protein
MKQHFISILMHITFKHNPFISLSGWTQSAGGWSGVLTDKVNGDAYRIEVVPIKSEKIVAPSTFNQLFHLN